MRFYIAARWGARSYIGDVVTSDLELMGHTVVSTWQYIKDGDGQAAIPQDDALAIFEAVRDEEEVRACDALLTVTYPEAQGTGHLVEWGMALALSKVLLVAGPVKTVFHKRADIIRPSWDEMRVTLAENLRWPGKGPVTLPTVSRRHFP